MSARRPLRTRGGLAVTITAAVLAAVAFVSARSAMADAPPSPSPSPSASASPFPVPAAYERTAFDGKIWQVTPDAASALTFAQWQRLGAPAYTSASTAYQKVALFPTVYAVTTFQNTAATVAEAPVTAAQFAAAGAPRISTVPWIAAIRLFRWETSSELFAEDANAHLAKLTFAQWQAAGAPKPSVQTNTGFIRMSWDTSGTIAYMCDASGGHGGRISYAQWTALGAPAPRVMKRVTGDIVLGGFNWSWDMKQGEIQYMGPITVDIPGYGNDPLPHWNKLSYPEWRAMGSPTPVLTETIYPEKQWCATAVPTPASLLVDAG